nr:ATP synthase F0 subunit 8 [Dielis tejensis]
MYQMMPIKWLFLYFMNWVIMIMILSLFVYIPFSYIKSSYNKEKYLIKIWLNKW